MLPSTASNKGTRWPRYALAAAVVFGLFCVAVSLSVGGGASPGEELESPVVQDVVVSTEDVEYPSGDALRFEGRPERVYVYLAVQNLPRGADLEAEVRRAARSSLLSRLLPGRGVVLSGGGEEQLDPGGAGLSGVVKFEVRPRGETLPRGSYEIEVRVEGEVVAHKYFEVGG
ncbi:MAG: hypothetical protein AB1425_13890 [Actinomycetota bacterium]